ncbi:UDP-glucose 4-epimerase GalE [Candidatus Peregrinibacteria bacterium]|nr:UDP-glucose 4-epimerase GalE [Candidatus Peregrinibacteria bacterium]
MNKEILITGGAGYIGANIVDLLIKKKYKVVVIDNLSTGNKSLIHPDAIFYNVDISDKAKLEEIFRMHIIDTVIHLAALSSVGESAKKPKKYFKNNVKGGLNLLEAMVENECKKIIFSSSAAVYGNPQYVPINEDHPINPISIYGETKATFEEKLKLFDKQHDLKFLSLRYFNAGGSSDDNRFGEIHIPETHLIPSILKLAAKNREISIFGDDYDTKDGTCIRDYIHVVDIAEAHILGIEYLGNNAQSEMINLGTEKGYSVKEIINLCSKTLEKSVKSKIEPRRKGDPPILIASCGKAKKLLNWEHKKTIHHIIESAWKFEQKLSI